MSETGYKKLEKSIDDLARLTKQGFDEMHQFRDEMSEFKEEMYEFREEMHEFKQQTGDNFTRVNARLDLLERDVSDIRKHFVYRDEFDNVVERLERIEQLLKIKPEG